MKFEKMRTEIETVLEPIPVDWGGGCSASKAHVLASIIASERITQSIDLGIYRGRSFFPQAWAHRTFTKGQVIGIDPYSTADARETDEMEFAAEISSFIESTDYDGLYDGVMAMRQNAGFELSSTILRQTSASAAPQLAAGSSRFGLIHIDGNHDRQPVINDVIAYMPLLMPNNGFLVMDDISWTSVKPAVDYISKRMTLLYARVDLANDYAVFWNGTGTRRKSALRARIALAGEN
jgi:hypothetical protein